MLTAKETYTCDFCGDTVERAYPNDDSIPMGWGECQVPVELNPSAYHDKAWAHACPVCNVKLDGEKEREYKEWVEFWTSMLKIKSKS